ncbi:alanine dehydrogenase [Flaviflexus salsibiostraticola]|uniref:Alanine dehydrogenase n=1 Tax=Flaviflexus salsibiostraticola TaxID=1282737 RepID=A0A3S8Z762_9ACTO|nr:alanine dehydrogenase [Flaviflexus salsibiostraticola]AZN29320.1 alanine dehydrogenase [Flaviflexus salsibiostraticola]
MIIGIPVEIKDDESRVGLTPAGAAELIAAGHSIVVQTGAGAGALCTDEDYAAAGAEIVDGAEAVWERADLVVKVKEPIGRELDLLREGQTLFTYLHLAADEELSRRVVDSGATAIAYETVQLEDGSLPLLMPMSEIAGRLAPQEAAHLLMKPFGGPGRLMGGVPGVPPVRTLILGAGTVGSHAAKVAVGMGADVTIMDINTQKLRELDREYGTRIRTHTSSPAHILEEARAADVIIGTVLIPGGRTPQLITAEMVPELKQNVLLIDVAIDQGGCFVGSRPTSHHDPIFHEDGRTYYCVGNMPGAVPVSATTALTDQTLPYIKMLAEGPFEAMRARRDLALGLQAAGGRLVEPGVAEAFGLPLEDLDEVLAAGRD